ncbi:unnamed protein product [Adineta ricciae]|uniref:Nuclear transport factor 2 family protein n=1 Tax=Adineta ricciae TaxID=249248 RepID=A0A815G6N2_ADIRI|nr:unnamed protein product [Adineta ricciae]CAF1617157.1 unnamed protein product [Adineta ricciae]
MSTSAQYKKIVETMTDALNKHNIDEFLTHYGDNCEVIRDGQCVIRSKDEFKKYAEERFSNPDAKANLVEFLPSESDDRIRFIVEHKDKKRYEQTCVFSKEGKVVQVHLKSLNNN